MIFKQNLDVLVPKYIGMTNFVFHFLEQIQRVDGGAIVFGSGIVGVTTLKYVSVSTVSPKYNWVHALFIWLDICPSEINENYFFSIMENVKGHPRVDDIKQPKPKRH